MRTTVELPDELMRRAKAQAALQGISLKTLFTQAIEDKLSAGQRKKMRRPPPVIGDPNAPKRIRTLTREQIDEAMFG